MIRHWVHNILAEAIPDSNVLPEGVWSSLKKITEIFETLPEYHFHSDVLEDLADAVIDVETITELGKLLWRTATSAGFQHANIFAVSCGSSRAPFRTRSCSSFPEAWLTRYVEANLHSLDPIFQIARSSQVSAVVQSRDVKAPFQQTFWTEASNYGIGNIAFVVPVTVSSGARVAVSFQSSCSADVVDHRLRQFGSDLEIIARLAADKFAELAQIVGGEDDVLSSDEIKFLWVLASTGDQKRAAEVRGAFGSNKALQVSIREKLGVETMVQAVAIAAARGLFEDGSIEHADVEAVFRGLEPMDEGAQLAHILYR